ncbi:MAG TPA: alpha/beta hydrolase [Phycisphaerae bacterium]|nr:alpha/beta hydrolase [Phycisphaerae bacterium]
MSDAPALPWDWFDFAQPSRALPDGGFSAVPTIDQGGADIVFTIAPARRTLLFKILRRSAAAPQIQRPLLVLLHGMGLTTSSFRGIAPWLLASHDLLLIDYSGLACAPAGLSPSHSGWSGALSARHIIAGIFHVLDALRIPRADFAGNSLGGGMCLVAALEAPQRVGRIVLSNPACYPQTLPRTYRWARVPLLGPLLMATTRPEKLIGGVEYIGYVDKSRFAPDLRSRYLRNMSHRANRFRLMQMIRALPGHERDLAAAPHVPRLREIRSPVLISWGEQDPLLVQGAGERLAADLPCSTYRPYPDLAHMPHEEAPERLGPEWSAFLNPHA